MPTLHVGTVSKTARVEGLAFFLAEGIGYGPTRRRPLEEVAFYVRWGDS